MLKTVSPTFYIHAICPEMANRMYFKIVFNFALRHDLAL